MEILYVALIVALGGLLAYQRFSKQPLPELVTQIKGYVETAVLAVEQRTQGADWFVTKTKEERDKIRAEMAVGFVKKVLEEQKITVNPIIESIITMEVEAYIQQMKLRSISYGVVDAQSVYTIGEVTR